MSSLDGMTDATSKCVADHLAIACDQLGEAVAWMYDRGAREPSFDNVMAAVTTLTKLRAELGFTGGMVVADLESEDE